MRTTIQDDLSIEEVKNLFSSIYPNLQLELFERDMHGLIVNTFNQSPLDCKRMLGEFRIDKVDAGVFDLFSDRPLREFAEYIDSGYCLHARVSVRFGKGWKIIPADSELSLKQHNQEGAEAIESCY